MATTRGPVRRQEAVGAEVGADDRPARGRFGVHGGAGSQSAARRARPLRIGDGPDRLTVDAAWRTLRERSRQAQRNAKRGGSGFRPGGVLFAHARTIWRSAYRYYRSTSSLRRPVEGVRPHLSMPPRLISRPSAAYQM